MEKSTFGGVSKQHNQIPRLFEEYNGKRKPMIIPSTATYFAVLKPMRHIDP